MMRIAALLLALAPLPLAAQTCAPGRDELLPTAPGSGRHSTVRESGFADHYLWGPGDRVKIGVREQWGGSIVFFGLAAGAPASNVIDAHDTGREVQLALYDPDRLRQGCAHDASCKKSLGACSDSISFLGWNPVQGGNKCNQGSPVLGVTAQRGALEVETAPLHWNPDWRESTCVQVACSRGPAAAGDSDVRFRQRLRFVDEHVVELELEARNLRDESHAPYPQEFPTVYATYGARGTQDISVLLSSAGARIAIDQPANDGFFTREFDSPGGWVTLQNANGTYGVGLYAENRLQRWQGWQRPGKFNNVRPVFTFGLPARGTVRARSYLILGSHATVAALAAKLERELPPFGALEQPRASRAFTGGELAVSGWALDNTGVREVEISIEGKTVARLAPGQPSPELCRLWPGYARCGRAGFAGTISLLPAEGCRQLRAIAVDLNGNRHEIGRAALGRGDCAASCR